MRYTVSEAAKRSGISAHALRYYDREGLLPYVERDASGNRSFKEDDFRWLHLISCLKKTGMPIRQIRQYVQWSMEGDATLSLRLEMIREHKKAVAAGIRELQTCMELIDEKERYYEAKTRTEPDNAKKKKQATASV